MELDFIKSKINIPKVKEKIVKRKTLFNKLNKALNCKLIIISAPAGFGKSTLLSSWLSFHAKDEFLVSWASLTETEKDSAAFWKCILYSIDKAHKGLMDNSFAMLRSLQVNEDFNKSFLAVFISELSKLEKNFLIIMDDLQLAADEKIYDDLKFLLKNLPDNVHLLISSRIVPNIGLARVRANGDLLEIHQWDLAFSKAEIQSYFKDVMDLNLSEKTLEFIEQRTEGWVAGLQMAALYLKGKNNEVDLVKYFNGGHRYVLDYLMDEVLNGLGEEFRDFLIKTAFIDEMCAGLCNEILLKENSQQILEELDKNHLFIIPLDETRQWYRYHHLFREFLQRNQHAFNAAIIENIFYGAAEWYEKNNYFSKAISLYLKAHKYEEAAGVIEKIDIQIMFNDEMKQVYEWCKVLPHNLMPKSPKFYIHVAWFNCVNGDKENTDFYLMQAENLLSLLMDNQLKNNYYTEIMIIRAWFANIKNDTNTIKECLEKAKNYTGLNELLKALILLLNGVISIYGGKITEAIRFFDETLKISKRLPTYYLSVMANTNIILSKLFCGQLLECEMQCVYLLRFYQEKYETEIPLLGAVYNDLATVYYEWNRLDKAMECAEKALTLGEKGDIAWIRARSYSMVSKIYLTHSDIKNSVQYIEKAEQDMILDKNFDVTGFIERAKAEIFLKTGHLEELKLWTNEKRFNFDLPNLFYHLIEAKLFFYQNSFDQAEDLLTKICEAAEKGRGDKALAEALLLWSMIHDQKGLHKRATEDLSKAINLSCQQRYIRVFINEGQFLKRLFLTYQYEITNNLTKEGMLFLEEILKEYKTQSQPSRTITTDILSEREKEIIRYLKSGLTNAEISEMMYVSLNTVKTHLFNIYAKLDVHNRTTAIMRAEELNIIK